MKRKSLSILSLVLVLGFLLVGLSGSAGAQESGPRGNTSIQTVLGTAFIYQGRLTDLGNAANGTYDFEFKLYDDAGGGSQVGYITRENVTVTNGVFTVELDFGTGAFNGNARWLEIGVRPGSSTDTFTTLAPRQPLSPAPYALALPGLWTQPNETSPNVIGGYSSNSVTGGVVGATIGGGGYIQDGATMINQVSEDYGTIGGGFGNTASGSVATIGGGGRNLASGNYYATVCGGQFNTASGAWFASVGGGGYNTASGSYATVPGGYHNTAQGDYSFAAGYRAQANHNGAFVWADSTDADFASTANDQFLVRASGGVTLNVAGGALRLEPDLNLIGGYSGNNVTNGVVGATISGGGRVEQYDQGPNTVTDEYGTVGGGEDNRAGNDNGIVTDAWYATVGGGLGNTASGNSATISGGSSNEASGDAATVPGGFQNTAQGNYSFAAGVRAKANNAGCFVWGDSTFADVTCDGNNQFIVRASGGLTMYTSSDLSSGVTLAAGSSTWSDTSDRNLKENFAPVDVREVLAHVAEIPITTWNYKSQDPAIRHIGPMAQDFYTAFGLGEDDKHINTVNADGVALAAIQGLHQIVQVQDARIETLEAENAALQQRLDNLSTRVAALEEQPDTSASWPGEWSSLSLLVSGLIVGLVVVGRKEMLRRSPGGE